MSPVRARLSRVLVMAIVSGVIGAGVGRAEAASNSGSKINAVMASFDPYAGADQRLIIGLLANDGRTLAFGQVNFAIGYAGTKERPLKQVTATQHIAAPYLPIPDGQPPSGDTSTSRLVRPSKSRGVYGGTVRFDKPGLWRVQIKGRNGSQPFSAQTVFEVAAAPQVTPIGEPAPRSTNPLPGAPGTALRAIDSRADGPSVPDPELHQISVADAIASGKPLLVVVSTPTYCVSQFCGPITDNIQKLARQYGDRMNFVHLEVWRSFRTQQFNDAAAEWVRRRDNKDANEPWVFVVDRSGTVVERFDNVATAQELQGAISSQLAS